VGKKSKAALIYVHGGGGVIGIGVQPAGLLDSIATGNDIVVFSMNYRVAPIYKMPQI